MTDAFATPADLAAIWRPLTDEEEAAALVWLSVASAMIRRRFSDIDTRIAAGTLDPAIVGHVAVMMVKRVMSARDPEDPISESIGEATQTWDRPGSDATLFFADDDLALLAPLSGRRARTITLGVGLPLP
jgi:hypothetical protein